MKEMQQQLPELQQLKQELEREKRKGRLRKTIRSTIYTLLIVAAIAVLIATFLLRVYKVYGSSMTPTLSSGQIVVAVKTKKYKPGDVIAMYYGNKLLIKRCIAPAGKWVDIDEDGNVSVNNKALKEPYLVAKHYGRENNIEYPYQVPENSIFVMGDHRETSVDSRSTSVGCIDLEGVEGKVFFCIWPLKDFGPIK